jgi:large subunit ribosomal protein L23
MMLHVLKTPHLTEKSILQKEIGNQVTFVVEPDANKIEIKKAVEELFKVTVLQVHTINMRGKKKRLGRFTGRRPNWKKAMVTLKEGDRIEYFEGA